MSLSPKFNTPQKGELTEAAKAADEPQGLAQLKDLLDRGADVNDADDQGITALVHLSTFGNKEGVALLLERHADVNRQTDGGKYTALLCAAAWGHEDIMALLLKNGADPRIKDNKGHTALDWAQSAKEKNDRIINMLTMSMKLFSLEGSLSSEKSIHHNAFGLRK